MMRKIVYLFICVLLCACSNKDKGAVVMLQEFKDAGYDIETIASCLKCDYVEVLTILREGELSVSDTGKKKIKTLYEYFVDNNKLRVLSNIKSGSLVNNKYSSKSNLTLSNEQRATLEFRANTLFQVRLNDAVENYYETQQQKFIDDEFGFFSSYYNMLRSIFIRDEKLTREWKHKINNIFDPKGVKERISLIAKEYAVEVNTLRDGNHESRIKHDNNEFNKVILKEVEQKDLKLTKTFHDMLLNEILQEFATAFIIKISIIILALFGIKFKKIGIAFTVIIAIFFGFRAYNIQNKIELQLSTYVNNHIKSQNINICPQLNQLTMKYYDEKVL